MYPILFTFLPLYFIYLTYEKLLNKKSSFIILGIFIFSFIIFNTPQFLTSRIGPTYSDLAADAENISQAKSNQKQLNSKTSSKLSYLLRVGNKFYKDFLLPKDNGKYLLLHLEKDLSFFAANNIIVLFGLILSVIYLFRFNKLFGLTIILIFFTSFILWGNMNFYGGGGVDLNNLRNSHTRYLLPVITLFYILGFFYLPKIIKNRLLLLCILMLTIARSFISLTTEYPFLNYSLINKNGYVYDYLNEKNLITKLPIPNDAIFVSAAFDDYDLSYSYENYANLKLLSQNPVKMKEVLHNFITKKSGKVYLLYPEKDSRFNPITKKDINDLYSYIQSNFSSKVIFEDEYKKLLVLSLPNK